MFRCRSLRCRNLFFLNHYTRETLIMAYLSRLREWRPRSSWGGMSQAAAALRRLRAELPVDCLLCRERAPGALCELCRVAVCASMQTEPRCSRCDLAGVSYSDCPDCRAMPPLFERTVAAFDYAWPGDLLIHQLKRQNRYVCAPAVAALLAARCEKASSEAAQCETVRSEATCCEKVRSEAARCEAVRSEATCCEEVRSEEARCKVMRRDSLRPVVEQHYKGTLEPKTSGWCSENTVVVPVPAGRRALARRGFNPAAELGRELAGLLGLAWRPHVLLRVREGEQQKGLTREARRDSVAELYACTQSVQGRDILVVDDVMTTGSTLNAVAALLKAQGARGVWGAVAARTSMRGPAA